MDIHFHGAFGIDLMTADLRRLNLLSLRLWRNGVAGFCPTTLSAPLPDLLSTVRRLGEWIRSKQAPGAQPLGIHLEGPFVNAGACGAHPPSSLRAYSLLELKGLWEASGHTLKIVTVAPEILKPHALDELVKWADSKKIALSLGHSRATESQARAAIEAGFSGVTHAWNAMAFHHRLPGVLGAALGKKSIYLELIPDLLHVSAPVIHWTRVIHTQTGGLICFVSDCVPAAMTPKGSWHAFGPLRVTRKRGACFTQNNLLAGGGQLLPRTFIHWLKIESQSQDKRLVQTFRHSIASVTTIPLSILNLPITVLGGRSLEWKFEGKNFIPRFRLAKTG